MTLGPVQRPAEAAIGAHVPRRDRDDLVEGLDGPGEVARLPQRKAETEMGIGEAGRQIDGAPVQRDALGEPALRAQGDAEVVKRPRVVGPQLDGPAVGENRFLDSVDLAKNGPEIVVGVGVVWSRLDRLLDELDGLAVAAALMIKHAQVRVEGIWIAGLADQDASIDHLRLGERAAAVEFDSPGEDVSILARARLRLPTAFQFRSWPRPGSQQVGLEPGRR